MTEGCPYDDTPLTRNTRMQSAIQNSLAMFSKSNTSGTTILSQETFALTELQESVIDQY